MTTPQTLHHALLRPCVLHILRAAGFHSTRPSVVDALTDIAARFLVTIAQSTMAHASVNHSDQPELAIEVGLQDVRMAMEACGVIYPEETMMDQEYKGVEDTRGMDNFISWATGPSNKEIRRIAFEGGDGSKDDYLTGMFWYCIQWNSR
jgi:transcription initiation factor TFIID subunit 3